MCVWRYIKRENKNYNVSLWSNLLIFLNSRENNYAGIF